MFRSQIVFSILCLTSGFVAGGVEKEVVPNFVLSGEITPSGYILNAGINGLNKENGKLTVSLAGLDILNRDYLSSDSQVLFPIPASTGLLSYEGVKELVILNTTSTLNESFTYQLRGFEHSEKTVDGYIGTEDYLTDSEGERIISCSYDLTPNEDYVLPRNIDFSTSKMFYLTLPDVSTSNLAFFLNKIPFQITKTEQVSESIEKLTLSGPVMNVDTSDSIADMDFVIRLKNDVSYQDTVFKVKFPVVNLLGEDGLFNFHFELYDN